MSKVTMGVARCVVAASLLAVSASAASAGPIGLGDFVSPTIETYGSTGLPFFNVSPLTIGPVTFSATDGIEVWDTANGAPFLDCQGGCVTNANFDAGLLDLSFDQPYEKVGLYAGQATPYNLDVMFFDAGHNLLGTTNIVNANAGGGVTFVGWEDLAGVAAVRIDENGDDFFLVSAQSVYLEQPVPEPASLLLLGSGLVGAALRRRKRA